MLMTSDLSKLYVLDTVMDRSVLIKNVQGLIPITFENSKLK